MCHAMWLTLFDYPLCHATWLRRVVIFPSPCQVTVVLIQLLDNWTVNSYLVFYSQDQTITHTHSLAAQLFCAIKSINEPWTSLSHKAVCDGSNHLQQLLGIRTPTFPFTTLHIYEWIGIFVLLVLPFFSTS